jgi:hypothetical protein
MPGTCGGNPFTGGRRRRTAKKKLMKGGMGYGFGGAMGTNGPVWGAAWGGEVTKSGTPVYDTADPQRGSSRRRKSKKTKKGGKRRRTMRGGAQWQSVAPVGHGYTGSGARGLATHEAYASKVPPSGGPSQNPDGAYRP